MALDRLPVHALDPAGGTPGQVPTINAAGTALEYANPSGGSGGGGLAGGVRYSDTLGGTNFTTTTFNSYVTITGLSFTVTPAVDSILVLNSRIGLFSSASNNLNAKVLVSPAPPAGSPSTIRVRDDNGQANKGRTLAFNADIELSAGVTYTFTMQAYQSTAGTLTVYGDQDQTELSGTLFPTEAASAGSIDGGSL